MSLLPSDGQKPRFANGHADKFFLGETTSGARADGTARRVAARGADEKRARARTLARQQQAAERIAQAAAQLAAGVTEATAGSEELSQSMQMIAKGAEQAAAASEEGMAAMTQIDRRVKLQSAAARTSREKTRELEALISRTGDGIGQLVANVAIAARRQEESVATMARLEEQASGIIESVNQVIRIADQTNLLALNAAIEAARAGKHGKGFAVVATTVRTLAEASEKNATDIEQLVRQIQDATAAISQGVGKSAENALAEVRKGAVVSEQLAAVKGDMATIMEGAAAIDQAATEMAAATAQTLKGSEMIAAAAEEQSAAVQMATKSVEQQSTALAQCDSTARELDGLADELKNSTNISKSSEEMAAAAEELSAALEEVSKTATGVMAAIEQISAGAQQQAAASEEAVAGITQIEKGSALAERNASEAMEKAGSMSRLVSEVKDAVDGMIAGIGAANEAGKQSVVQIEELETLSGRIDKIVDAIANVAIQTSMLAVNGAVEAARAGVYGKGFAVVSTDIQNLADDAAENAETIKDMVKAIQKQIGTVRGDLLSIAASAAVEVEKAKEATTNLVAVEADMKEILGSSATIRDAAVEISAAITQAKKGMEQISAAAEQSSVSAQQAATAASQQRQAAEQLAGAVEEIASTADELQTAA
jgi:methyl-accepting chemotaxis protein